MFAVAAVRIDAEDPPAGTRDGFAAMIDGDLFGKIVLVPEAPIRMISPAPPSPMVTSGHVPTIIRTIIGEYPGIGERSGVYGPQKSPTSPNHPGYLIPERHDDTAGASDLPGRLILVKHRLLESTSHFNCQRMLHIGDTSLDEYYTRLAGFEFRYATGLPPPRLLANP
jgi:hypothetical protein